MGRFTTSEFFGELNGREFSTYRSLEENVVTIFNKYRAKFPPQYSYRNLIEWGLQNKWIVPWQEGGFRIVVKRDVHGFSSEERAKDELSSHEKT